MKMKNSLLGLVFCAFAATSLASSGNLTGQSAPDFALKSSTGENLRLSEFRGDVVMVNFWATWCKPCRAELPELARLHRELGPRGFEVLAVNIDTERLESKVRKMTADFDLPFTVLRDPEGSVVGPWQVVGYPTSFLVGRESELLWRRDGIIFEQDPELGALLETSLAAKAS